MTITKEQIDEIREMFKNDDGTCKLSRLDVLLIVEKLEAIAEAE